MHHTMLRFGYPDTLVLMMVDRKVRFHVVPRYSRTVEACGMAFPDTGWPGVPALGEMVSLDGDQMMAMRDKIRACLPNC